MCIHTCERENDLHVDSEWELLFSLFTFALLDTQYLQCSVSRSAVSNSLSRHGL